MIILSSSGRSGSAITGEFGQRAAAIKGLFGTLTLPFGQFSVALATVKQATGGQPQIAQLLFSVLMATVELASLLTTMAKNLKNTASSNKTPTVLMRTNEHWINLISILNLICIGTF